MGDPLVTVDTHLSRFVAPIERILGVTLLGNGTVRALRGTGNGTIGAVGIGSGEVRGRKEIKVEANMKSRFLVLGGLSWLSAGPGHSPKPRPPGPRPAPT